MLVSLILVSGLVIAPQRAPLATIAGGALIALPAIAVARYVLCAVRQRSRPPAGRT